MRHRVHHRARQAVDAADPGGQAHRRCGVPHRDAAGRPGSDRHGRSGVAGLRRTAGAADVPALRHRRDQVRQGEEDRAGHERLARRRGGQGRLRLLHRGQVVALGRGGDPRAPRDEPRRPQRHDRRERHPDQPRRQDLARGGRRARHGQDLRVRRRVARRQHQAADPAGARRARPRQHRDPRGRCHLDRRHLGRGVRR